MPASPIYGLANEDAGYGYVNVPKAACTSIKGAIMVHMGHPTWEPPLPEPKDMPIVHAEYVRTRRDLHWFSFVRHPCDRLVSFWTHFLQPPFDPLVLASCTDLHPMLNLSFGEFIAAVTEMPVERMDPHFAPQTSLIFDGMNPLFDALYHFETLGADWHELQRRFGLPDLPHHRQTDHPPWRRMFTPELLRMVSQPFAHDFQILGYSPPVII